MLVIIHNVSLHKIKTTIDTDMNNEKTVYILGAGFSVEAGAPTQAAILERAFDSIPPNNRYLKTLENFITTQLNIPKSELNKVQLEDIFTPLDRCRIENAQFRDVTPSKISNIRQAAFRVVSETLYRATERQDQKQKYIDRFAELLCLISQKRMTEKSPDRACVISTNWDTLLDDAIYKKLQKINSEIHYSKRLIELKFQPSKGFIKETMCVVDYCCHISSLDKNDESVKPGLEIIGRGGFTVKILKLHGSLNWLQCPRCFRLYTAFDRRKTGKKAPVRPFQKIQKCRHCDNNFSRESSAEKSHSLEPNLIMPTYIKDLSNPQYRIIWQNAGIEISEASKLVFIGYSLPQADFEIRSLLSRMTRENAEIEVVDFIADDDPRKESIEANWKTFFGKRNIKFYFDGASEYIHEITKDLDT